MGAQLIAGRAGPSCGFLVSGRASTTHRVHSSLFLPLSLPCHTHTTTITSITPPLISGAPIAYHLHPAQGPCLLAQPNSPVAQRGLFTTKSLWVTPHVDGQLYPAGTYVMQSTRDSGLAVWTQQVCVVHGAGDGGLGWQEGEKAWFVGVVETSCVLTDHYHLHYTPLLPPLCCLQDRSLLGADPVLWYTFGVSHFVRPEDYPVGCCVLVG